MKTTEGVKKRIGFISIIVFFIVGCDWLVGAVTGKMIRNVGDVGVNQTNTAQALFARKADVLILGSSRANHSFDCRILEDSLGMKCYNAGRDGQNMVYDAMVFFTYIERHIPKIVILDVASSMMDDSWFGNLNEMNCYYGLAKPLDRIVDENSTWIERLKLKSNLYRYNNTWQWLLNARMAKSAADLDGYQPMPVNVNNPFKVRFVNEKPYQADNRCQEYLGQIINTCKENNIRIVITYVPSLSVTLNGGVDEWAEKYCDSVLVPFVNFEKDSSFYNHSELFYDPTHLNEKGAELFTKSFIRKLKMQR
jgi:hypothetical protein